MREVDRRSKYDRRVFLKGAATAVPTVAIATSAATPAISASRSAMVGGNWLMSMLLVCGWGSYRYHIPSAYALGFTLSPASRACTKFYTFTWGLRPGFMLSPASRA